jgi:hypothetical protein
MHRPQTGLRRPWGRLGTWGPVRPGESAKRQGGREEALAAVKTRFTSNASANSHITPNFPPISCEDGTGPMANRWSLIQSAKLSLLVQQRPLPPPTGVTHPGGPRGKRTGAWLSIPGCGPRRSLRGQSHSCHNNRGEGRGRGRASPVPADARSTLRATRGGQGVRTRTLVRK